MHRNVLRLVSVDPIAAGLLAIIFVQLPAMILIFILAYLNGTSVSRMVADGFLWLLGAAVLACLLSNGL